MRKLLMLAAVAVVVIVVFWVFLKPSQTGGENVQTAPQTNVTGNETQAQTGQSGNVTAPVNNTTSSTQVSSTTT